MEAVVVHVPVAGLYSSAVAYGPPPLVKPPSLNPPVTRTWPLGSRVAVCCSRGACIEPVTDHVPVAGLYSSASLRSEQKSSSQLLNPPATSTCPSGSRVAVARSRPSVMLPVALQVPVAGL